MKFFILLISITILLSSCSYQGDNIPYAVKELSKREPEIKYKTDFNSVLAVEYLKYAKSLLRQHDPKNAEYFATKAIRALNEGNVSYEIPSNWSINPDLIPEINFAQARLNFLLSNYLKWLPSKLARLFIYNDCWIYQEANKNRLTIISDQSCKTKFYKLLATLEQYIDNIDNPQLETSAKQIAISELEFNKFEIFFDLASYKINEQASQKLLEIINYIKSLNGDYKILLVGTADRNGSEIYNRNLAIQRAKIITNYLTTNGVPSDLIESRALGSSFPAVITPNNSKEDLNRRVMIYILKNSRAQLLEIPLPLIENYVYKEHLIKLK